MNLLTRKTPRVGLEPTTTRLTAECSTIELSRKKNLRSKLLGNIFDISRLLTTYLQDFLYLATKLLGLCTLKTEHESIFFQDFG